MDIETKEIKTTISNIGEISIKILVIGTQSHSKQIEDFIKNSEARFIAIIIQKPELKNNLFLQRAIQAFINHIQASGIEQTANLMRSHFKNWLFSQNGNLQKIITDAGNESNIGNDRSGDSQEGKPLSSKVQRLRNW